MKKTSMFHTLLVVSCSFVCLFLGSCRKDAGTPETVSTSSSAVSSLSGSSEMLNGNEISLAISPSGILGTYSVRGSRTVYRGQANDNGDNIILSIDYINEKKILPSPETKSLTCGYGETNFVNQGWKYLIRYNKATGKITLAPNDVMAAAIKPNSFECLSASYDAVYKQFFFQTRFTNLDGNENEVVDILAK